MNHSDDQLGSVAEEAVKLVAAAQDWFRNASGGRSVADWSAEHIATGTAACDWCPLCALIAALRGERPELSEKISAAAGASLDAVRALLDVVSARPADAVRVQPVHFDA